MKKLLFVSIIICAISCQNEQHKKEQMDKKNEDSAKLYSLNYKYAEEDAERLAKNFDDSLATYVKKALTPEVLGKLKKLKVKKDEFQGDEFYSNPKDNILGSYIKMYIVKSDKDLFDRIKIQFEGTDWLFVYRYEFICDGKKYTITPNEVKRQNGSGYIWETSDDAALKEVHEIVAAIINSKEAKMRYVGKEGVFDRTIGKSEKQRIADIYSILN